MTAKSKFIFALTALYALLGGITGLLYLSVWADLNTDEKQAILHILGNRVGIILFILLMALVAIGMVFELLFRSYVKAPLRLREKLSVILAANHSVRLRKEGSAELRTLTGAINQLADQRDELQRKVTEKIREANASVVEEKNRFAALISELSQSVIVCNIDGRILLYNHRARALFQARADKSANPGSALIGLGRSIFAAFERQLITHALEKIQTRIDSGGKHAAVEFVTTTPAGQLIRAQMTPVLRLPNQDQPADKTDGGQTAPPRVSGYVLILDDITRQFEIESRRDVMLQSLTEGNRSALANMRAAVDSLHEYPDMDAVQRDRFIRILRDEVQSMSTLLDRTAANFTGALKVRWPLEEMLAVDLIQAAQRRIEQRLSLPTKTEDIDEALWIKADSFSLVQGLSYLASRLRDEYEVREVRFRVARSGPLAHLDLIWSGVVIGGETLLNWETDPMHAGGENSPLTLREIAERHGGEIWFQKDKLSHRSFVRMLIPIAEPPEALAAQLAAHTDSRPEYYDFDLFRQTEEVQALDDRPLTELTYTVFDTETTGLDPSAGDEIIQIGAARIVNGRLLHSEVFDQLINPRRIISAESSRIHGITNEVLAGQPTIEHVLPQFSAFAEDTVLVGHNAAFDMRFLQVKEASTGIAFRQPVLDTLLLSALIHPNQDSHRLEAIAERLGVNIVGRHTALGDAIVTGEVFLRMIPLLAEKGIRTLREAREAAERTYYAKIKY